ncbi:hypothetical protein [Verminephrobacter eiseniae]|uniref:Uncharacterized protein n=1 Tax=Verminephrobacter eiseniae (strain EF01-2) TaxID=391735 RepID=A1WFN8_VEREI|nr:hypothetical protein [Verminephrobacter eiseniae]KAB7590780.1 hypothetical protein ET532_015005 [Verminephrobacter sp. Larva24]ABM56445.1 hypothetical protein Veis_0662 [Verminephrobacter eiseniae EF01-2]MCW5233542.1 hypothetical protein [Verminephrobacter eiseniae]MCW5286806.1 hypothetical protein [Verminephrobacter eiseniae]MCW5294903.1 hypothetical protein [Verminephrobacter eiseniae]
MSELRALIREILVEELAALRAAPAATPACEMVDVHSDEALMAFARDLLGRANDPEFVRCVQSGQHRFTLAPTVAQPPGQRPAPAASFTLVASAPAEAPRFEKALVTERDVAAIPRDQSRIRLARNTRLTPLASDELRRRGIRIERTQK